MNSVENIALTESVLVILIVDAPSKRSLIVKKGYCKVFIPLQAVEAVLVVCEALGSVKTSAADETEAEH